ncbi:hypothetical protein KKF38_02210 [Patescibacteria group bacterium]|nr:hypothetical protein [Patescibacteria group bacterium]
MQTTASKHINILFPLSKKREGEAGAFKLQGGSRDGDLIEAKHSHEKQLTCHLGGRLTPLRQRRRFEEMKQELENL